MHVVIQPCIISMLCGMLSPSQMADSEFSSKGCCLTFLLQLGFWYTWVVLPIFVITAVFWVTRLNKVSLTALGSGRGDSTLARAQDHEPCQRSNMLLPPWIIPVVLQLRSRCGMGSSMLDSCWQRESCNPRTVRLCRACVCSQPCSSYRSCKLHGRCCPS